jgi:squalene synthase HpnC
MYTTTDHVLTGPAVREAFLYCERLVRSHYENFPVASLALPRDRRPYIAAVYAFARIADDYADEGAMSPQERLEKLADWGRKLEQCYAGSADHPVFVALAVTAERAAIPQLLLTDLLSAFRMDVERNRYETFEDLLFYCRHSANPVGRIVLHVFGEASERKCGLSDHICTALQLANFWQDARVDWKKGRMYLPLEDVRAFGYTEEALNAGVVDDRFRRLLKFQVDRTREFFAAGRPLLQEIGKALRLEVTLTWRGGMEILRKIERRNFDVLTGRPTLSSFTKASILLGTLFGMGVWKRRS